MNADYQVGIVGGGMVGACLAHALGAAGMQVALVEAHPWQEDGQSSYDRRVIALSHSTCKILEGLAIWPQLKEFVSPIRAIHVSDRGHFGKTRLFAREERVPALGYVIEAHRLGQVLAQCIESNKQIDFICPAAVTSVEVNELHATVAYACQEEQREIRVSLLVAADGRQSIVRRALGMPVEEWDYGQTAIIANVSLSKLHQHCAIERFTSTGPLALLPLQDGRCALVWTFWNHQAEEVLSWGDEQFASQLQDQIGYRLGKVVKVGQRSAYPLHFLRAQQLVRHGAVLIGNAAHTLHPVAGQGFNLGMRDVAMLAQASVAACVDEQQFASLKWLQDYEFARQKDYRAISLFTDKLARVFTNPLTGVGLVRSLGLLGVDIITPLKHQLARLSMGDLQQDSLLMRGLALPTIDQIVHEKEGHDAA